MSRSNSDPAHEHDDGFDSLTIALLRAELDATPLGRWVSSVRPDQVQFAPIGTHWAIGWREDYDDDPQCAQLQQRLKAAASVPGTPLDLQAAGDLNEAMALAAARQLGVPGVVRDGNLHIPALPSELVLAIGARWAATKNDSTAPAGATPGGAAPRSAGAATTPPADVPQFRRGGAAAQADLDDQHDAECGYIQDWVSVEPPRVEQLRDEVEHLLLDLDADLIDGLQFAERIACWLGLRMPRSSGDAQWADVPPF